jgi:hypothetical protein
VRLEEWAAFNVEHLGSQWPEMPAGIVDRAADVWEPLIAIADRVGDRWPELARHAAVQLNNARTERDPSLGVQLLSDSRRVFNEGGVDRLTSEDLVQALVALEESPWGDLRGKQLDVRGLARRLRRYDVRPGTHRFETDVCRGYLREDFHDAWQRYLVADVVDVAVPETTGETPSDVVLDEDEEGDGFTSIPTQASLLTNGIPQQAQHAQQAAERTR